MPADADPRSDFPPLPASESSTLGPRWIPPRKFARLFSDFKRPFYLLDNKDRVRFASSGLIDLLGTTEAVLIGLDCSRTLAGDEHRQPVIAGLLAIPESSRSTHVSYSAIGLTDPSTAPWTCRLVLPLDTAVGPGYLACFWLQADDPMVIQASRHVDWLSQADVQSALLDARRTLSRLDGLHSLIGKSPSAQLARRQTQAAIAGNMSVCVFGPVGIGKATLARAIYQHRRKREGRLMSEGRILPIDCRLMDRGLMQDTIELATEKDASQRSEVDHEPTTLLLVGVDLLAPDAHHPLTKFLAQHPSIPVFATSQVETLHRLHADQAWWEIVAHIHVMSIHLEPLYHRMEDIPALAESILEECRIANAGKVRRSLTAATLHWLQAYPWPGNHRELHQAIQEAYDRSTTATIESNHFSLAIRTFASHVLRPEPLMPLNLDKSIEDFERSLLQKAIDAFPRNRAAAARHLGISRTRLLRRLSQLGMDVSNPEKEPIDSTSHPIDTYPDQAPDHAPDQPVFEEINDEQKT